jgi:hypothetical protein
MAPASSVCCSRYIASAKRQQPVPRLGVEAIGEHARNEIRDDAELDRESAPIVKLEVTLSAASLDLSNINRPDI